MNAKQIFEYIRAFARCRSGVSAIEFALMAPILVFGTFATVDIGLGIAKKMEMDRNVQSGVQAAISLDRSVEDIKRIVEIAAGQPVPTVVVETQCACGDVTVTCGTTCSGGDLSSVYYAVSTSRPHAGIILPDRVLTSSIRVRVR